MTFFQLADLQTPLYRIAIYALLIVFSFAAAGLFSAACYYIVTGTIGRIRWYRVRLTIQRELRSEADRGRLTIAARVPR